MRKALVENGREGKQGRVSKKVVSEKRTVNTGISQRNILKTIPGKGNSSYEKSLSHTWVLQVYSTEKDQRN